MGMASYHLCRRTKTLLFLSTIAILITLLYFSSSHCSPPLLPPPPPSPSPCLSLLHNISWTHSPSSHSWSWASPALSCGFRRFSRSAASDLLANSSILVAGDSESRLIALAVLRLLLPPVTFASLDPRRFRRQSNDHLTIPDHNITVDFVWAPYESNLTRFLLRNRNLPQPGLIVLGSGLWHMLHVTNSSSYGEELVELARAARSVVTGASLSSPPRVFWAGLAALVNPMLNTAEKRAKMTRETWEEYNREVERRRVLRGSAGGGPFRLLDVGSLSRGCGRRCTVDGMHYGGVVYEAAVNVMLNRLVMESSTEDMKSFQLKS